MSEIGSGPSPARSSARLFRAWAQWAGVLALFLTFRVWRITADTDTAVTTLALCLGAAWQIRRLLPSVQQRPAPLTRGLAAGLLVVTFWQLAWIGTGDFWFLRIALIVTSGLWLLLAWGVAGLIWGWRVLAAFIIWAFFCDSPWQWSRDAYQTGDAFGPKLAAFTAQLGGWLLSQSGAPVTTHGTVIQLGAFAVSVGVPCTALPLVKLLLLLLVLATLLFRLQLWPALRIAIVTVFVSFFVSVARVMLLAVVVKDPPTFHYWHDADQGGGGWFTAAGMLIMAFLIARQVFRQMAAAPQPTASVVPLADPPVRWMAAAVLISLVVSHWQEAKDSPPSALPPLPAGYSLVNDRTDTQFQASSGQVAPDEAAWIRQVAYGTDHGTARLDFLIAYVPQTLTGNPLDHPVLTAKIPVPGRWNISPDGHYAWSQTPASTVWTTTLAQDGTLVATDAAWTEHLHRSLWQPSRWLAWLAHRQPLRDKRSYWIAAHAGRSDQPGQLPNLFSDWVAVLKKSP